MRNVSAISGVSFSGRTYWDIRGFSIGLPLRQPTVLTQSFIANPDKTFPGPDLRPRRRRLKQWREMLPGPLLPHCGPLPGLTDSSEGYASAGSGAE